jgi:lipid II:glycine glycyltransferase (peptidoglycan interpeptide bridge formation enzyme)
MKYTFNELSDKTLWNEFLENYLPLSNGVAHTTFVQAYNWLDFQITLGKKVLKTAIYDQDNKLVGLIAGVIIDAKRGKYLYIRNGPVIDWENSELVNATSKYLTQVAKKLKLWFIRVSPLIEVGSAAEKTFKKIAHSHKCPMNDVEALDTWLWDIREDEVKLFENIKKKVRYDIRKAEKDGVETFITANPEFIETYYEILKDTVQRQNWNSYSIDYIKKEFQSFAKDNKASIILMKYKDKYISGGVFIHFGDQTYYHYGASLTEFRKIPSMYLMIWEAVKLAKSKNNTYFNFWGIAPENKPDHPWTGLTSFKMKFPGFAQRWVSSRDIVVSKKYWLTNIYERIDKYRKGY